MEKNSCSLPTESISPLLSCVGLLGSWPPGGGELFGTRPPSPHSPVPSPPPAGWLRARPIANALWAFATLRIHPGAHSPVPSVVGLSGCRVVGCLTLDLVSGIPPSMAQVLPVRTFFLEFYKLPLCSPIFRVFRFARTPVRFRPGPAGFLCFEPWRVGSRPGG